VANALSPINELVNNISDSVEGLVAEITGHSKDPNVPNNPTSKDVAAVLSALDTSNWLKLSFPYTFSVVSLGGAGTQNPFTDFSLPIAPQSIKQTEEPRHLDPPHPRRHHHDSFRQSVQSPQHQGHDRYRPVPRRRRRQAQDRRSHFPAQVPQVPLRVRGFHSPPELVPGLLRVQENRR
jgi:hypothetical protein